MRFDYPLGLLILRETTNIENTYNTNISTNGSSNINTHTYTDTIINAYTDTCSNKIRIQRIALPAVLKKIIVFSWCPHPTPPPPTPYHLSFHPSAVLCFKKPPMKSNKNNRQTAGLEATRNSGDLATIEEREGEAAKRRAAALAALAGVGGQNTPLLPYYAGASTAVPEIEDGAENAGGREARGGGEGAKKRLSVK